jgi:hypothetical protein
MEARDLLVPSHDQLDAGGAERLDEIRVLFARRAEEGLDALDVEHQDHQVGTFK